LLSVPTKAIKTSRSAHAACIFRLLACRADGGRSVEAPGCRSSRHALHLLPPPGGRRAPPGGDANRAAGVADGRVSRHRRLSPTRAAGGSGDRAADKSRTMTNRQRVLSQSSAFASSQSSPAAVNVERRRRVHEAGAGESSVDVRWGRRLHSSPAQPMGSSSSLVAGCDILACSFGGPYFGPPKPRRGDGEDSGGAAPTRTTRHDVDELLVLPVRRNSKYCGAILYCAASRAHGTLGNYICCAKGTQIAEAPAPPVFCRSNCATSCRVSGASATDQRRGCKGELLLQGMRSRCEDCLNSNDPTTIRSTPVLKIQCI
jgi:hypothetical protein